VIDKTQTKIAIGIAAVIWFVLAVLTNQSTQATALKTFSIAGTVVTIVFLLYDRFIWKWKVVRAVTGKPLIAGTWRGILQSDYIRPGETQKIDPIPTVIRFKQTNSTLVATLFTGESESVSEQAKLIREDDDRWRLSWVYRNTPRQSVQERSEPHRGVCDLYVSGKEGEVLKGRYFTGRKTTGEIEFLEWSKHAYHDAASALDGDDFAQAKPFVKWF
jgi:hypothetical protein